MKKINTKAASLVLAFFCLTLFLLTSCHYYNLERKLPPDDADWYNKVRYIISKKESRMFLELPKAEREQFKEDFWARRDPDPSTEENEYKMEYYTRIERASELFLSEGKPGWLTDRGRIYILFGPPMDRITNPMSAYTECRELWYYGNFPVVFVDPTCTGNYRLVSYNLTPLNRAFNLMYLHEINLAQARAMQTIQGDANLFNFKWSVGKTYSGEDKIEGTVYVDIPYASIWFREDKGQLATVMDVKLEIIGKDEELVWEYKESFKIEISEEMLQEQKKNDYKIKIPYVIDKNLDLLKEKGNRIYIILTNQTGGGDQKKVLQFDR
jgi:GWxTD domain-containing protein